jgi:hypothetical protein
LRDPNDSRQRSPLAWFAGVKENQPPDSAVLVLHVASELGHTVKAGPEDFHLDKVLHGAANDRDIHEPNA